MEEEIKQLIQEIRSTENKLTKLKRLADKFNSPALKKELSSLGALTEDEIKSIRAELNAKEKLFKESENFSNVGQWSYCFKTGIMDWSKKTYEIFEYPENYEGTLNDFYMTCVSEPSALRFPEQLDKMKTTYDQMIMNQSIRTPSGNDKIVSFSSNPILNEKKEIVGVEGLVKDLTPEITGEKGLDNFFNLSSDLHCIVHVDQYFVKVSPAWTKLLGYSEKELLSTSYMDFIHPDDRERADALVSQIDVKNKTIVDENRYVTKNGEVVYLSWNSKFDPETNLAYCTARDVTQLRLAQNELMNDLTAKDLLLKEIHHRVKNNLQIISSLLSLQAGLNSNHDDLSILYEASQNRIKSMAAIHEMFYQSENLDKIEFGKYLAKLTDDLIRTFESKNKKVEIDLKTETVFVSLNKAIPLGLIINEIVTNAIKHGADEQGKSFVFVNLECLPNKEFQLTIGDQSQKAFTDILNQEVESLGLMLIKSLTEQIDGDIRQVTTDTGTVFKLLFTP
ncbi:hypothetical protein CW751_07040 [Brumimicrobium salinarum]|uniref:histidine kinase n=1 Tax=Brumimicrobium salinarum TaxID=2058658 RepID=A0A2I0R2W5_9FLAO|nr:histidine kinase dimerization/phosphoacceptor domain -containing protein [Brumimicrobium salinarum]PKR80917.1 hypothetical protein CW751_07040 [Brumimicrobium salinarum]